MDKDFPHFYIGFSSIRWGFWECRVMNYGFMGIIRTLIFSQLINWLIWDVIWPCVLDVCLDWVMRIEGLWYAPIYEFDITLLVWSCTWTDCFQSFLLVYGWPFADICVESTLGFKKAKCRLYCWFLRMYSDMSSFV